MNKCKICEKETKNKVYCSIICQHNGYKKLKIGRVECVCLYCNNKFETLQNKIDNGKKYCSRGCKDKHQKELYLKNGNPVYGNNHTDEWKNDASVRVKKLWRDEGFRDKVNAGQEKFFEDNGFWMGTDEESLKKRIETNLERFGVDNISKLPMTMNKRNKTCLDRYGKTSIDILRHSSWGGKNTSIEVKIGELLLSNNVRFETQYDVYYEKNKFKSYDFYLKDFNLLIEADGDYWHGNPIKYNDESILTEVQKINIENDKFKNKLAEEMGVNLIRFWETDIKKKNFKYILFNKLKEYGKEKN